MDAARIFRLWLPLALMWLLMAAEKPMLAAVIARLDDPITHLAAFEITFSLALIVESPVIMLLTAATALADNRHSYRRLLAFAVALGGVFTGVHLVVALTGAYGVFVRDMVQAPEVVVAPGRAAFTWMLAWTGAIALRRLWHGLMIRAGQPGRVMATTLMRVGATAAVCVTGMLWPFLPGASLAGLALSSGVTAGAVGAYVLSRRAVSDLPSGPQPIESYLSWSALVAFYAPLAFTSLIVLGGAPLVSFGLGRTADPLTALAIWPAVSGLLFVLRSGAYAYQEVVVALFSKPAAEAALRRYAFGLGAVLSGAILVFAVTPLGPWWFGSVTGLPPDLASRAAAPILMATPIPLLSVIVSWQRGRLVALRLTPAVTLAVAANLATLALVLAVGLRALTALPGAELGSAALSLGLVTECLVLFAASRRLAGRIGVRASA